MSLDPEDSVGDLLVSIFILGGKNILPEDFINARVITVTPDAETVLELDSVYVNASESPIYRYLWITVHFRCINIALWTAFSRGSGCAASRHLKTVKLTHDMSVPPALCIASIGSSMRRVS